MTPRELLLICSGVMSALPLVSAKFEVKVPALSWKLLPTAPRRLGEARLPITVPWLTANVPVSVLAAFKVIVPGVVAVTFRTNAPLVGAAGSAAVKT